MKPIGDFLSEKLARGLLAPPEQSSGAKEYALVVREAVPAKEATQLAAALEQYAATRDFAVAVNEAVRPPRPGESEDQFVRRAKDAIRNVLLAKFGGPAPEAEPKPIHTSDPGWLEKLAAAYAKRGRATVIDDAELGIDPAEQTILQLWRKAGAPAARLSAVLASLGVSAAAAAMIVLALLDPEPATKIGLLVAGGGAFLLSGGIVAVRILTGARPPHVRATSEGFEVGWEETPQPK